MPITFQFSCGRIAPTTSDHLRPLCYTSDLASRRGLHDIETDFLNYGIEARRLLSPDGVSCRFSSWCRQEDPFPALRGKKISGAYITSSLAQNEAVTKWLR